MKTIYRCRYFEFCNRYQQGYECRHTTNKAAAFDIPDEKRTFIVDGDMKIEIDPDENKRGGADGRQDARGEDAAAEKMDDL